jgi:multiple sugar transport system permease protein
MVPVYGIFVQLNIIDSMTGTILFMAAAGLPMGIFMMRNFIASIPPDLEEAAWVDGASRLGALRRIVVPLMMPSIVVIFISEFASTWGNFFVPFMLLMSPEKQPAAVSIYTFFGQHGTVAYGQLAAFSLLYSIPIVLIYVITESRVGNNSMMAGSVKG